MLKKLFCATVLLSTLAFTALQAQNTTYPTAKYSEIIPIDPMEYYGDVELADAENGISLKYVKTLTKQELLKFLTNETVLTSVAEFDKNGNKMFIPTRISEKGKQYIVTMDYVKFTTVDLKKDSDMIGELCVGVGFRVIANISSKAANVNLGDLFSISIAAKEKKVYGSLSIEVLGLHDPSITSLIPLPSEISAASIQSMMQAMAMVKQKMYEDKIDLNPQIVGLKGVKDGVTLPQLNEAVLEYHKIGKKNPR